MYLYRKELERIIENFGKDKALDHIATLYDSGLINLPQWNNLKQYINTKTKGV